MKMVSLGFVGDGLGNVGDGVVGDRVVADTSEMLATATLETMSCDSTVRDYVGDDGDGAVG